MTVLRGFIITITSGVVFALVGALAGYSLGLIAPDYYRTVFRMPPEISLDLAQAGLGLGATQGLGAGILIGLAIVVTVAWYNLRALEIQTRHKGPPA
ncbi:MAG: hypothetical protein JWN70_2035 [Planctomycetaceae bacterium]|nr:hypothetical protein [Planctomycetaceae bacterium]